MTRDALILAHGQPSDPAGPEAEIAALAARVGRDLPGWRLRGTTLAQPGGVEAALADLADPVVFPFFMADGWFVDRAIPDRLARAGRAGLTVLPPFGPRSETADLAAAVVARALALRGWAAGDTLLVCAAHGSGRSPRPAEVARTIAGQIGQRLGLRGVRTGFVEQAPSLAEVLRGAGAPALCLPLFVASWGHVLTDLPGAVAEAGFGGPVLPPLGTDGEVPALIARALADAGRPRGIVSGDDRATP